MSGDGNLHVVILAGGVGTRLWPVSRRSRPKQFQALLSERTMLEETARRVLPMASPERLWVVTGEEFVDLVCSQLPQVPAANILGEPFGRDSAPATALAVARIERAEPEATVLVTPADSFIGDAEAYRKYVELAAWAATGDHIVIFGIVPSRPETGYGYIQRGAPLGKPMAWAYRVERFTEKPDLATAARYITDGGYYWNMGQFLFRAAVFMDRCRRYLPGVAAGAAELAASDAADRECIARVYAKLPSISLDYGIAEKDGSLVVVPTAVEWSDVGSWRAVKEIAERHGWHMGDGQSHVSVGEEDCFVLAESGRLVVTIGVQGYAVVDTPDAVLVVREDRAQEVREALGEIARRGKEGYL